MRLSTKGRYAGRRWPSGRTLVPSGPSTTKPVALADIAERQDISLSYLEQLFAKLRRGGLVTSVRGPGGGYRLARPSGELRIADIIVAVDEPIRPRAAIPSSEGCTKTGARWSPTICGENWVTDPCVPFLVSLSDVVERRVLGRSRPCNDFDGNSVGSDGASGFRGGLTSMPYCDHNATAPLRLEARERSSVLCHSPAIRPRFMPGAVPRVRWSKSRAELWRVWPKRNPNP